MKCELTGKIRDCYAAMTADLDLDSRIRENAQSLRQAKYDLRQAKAAQLEYRGSVRSLLDRLKGSRDQTVEELAAAVRKAEAELQSQSLEKERLANDQAQIRQQLEALPDWDSLRGLALENEETAREFRTLDARYCISVLEPLLEQNRRDLTEYGRYLRGEYLGKMTTPLEAAGIQTAPGESGEACAPLVARLRDALENMGIPMGSYDYFDNPVAYVVTAAAQHNRLDLCRRALDQAEALKMEIQYLKQVLSM